ncbi:MAG: flagellar filament capping protein FliD [Polyangiaceae bacterium]
MAGTISFGGIGSGLDTEGIVQGLVSASSGQLSSIKSRAASTHAAVSTLSDIGSLLATLKSALGALSDSSGVKSFAASTSDEKSVTASATSTAQAGAWAVSVGQLAKEQRTYSGAFASSSNALGQAGSLSIQVGSGTAKNISVEATDSLDSVVTKINASGLRVSASVLFDGTNYRMQVRGLDTGATNAITFGETGTTLGLTAPGATVQAAQDSQIEIDGFTITRATNQVTGAIPGVTLNLSQETTDPVTVKVDADAEALKKKLQTFVDAYSAVVKKVHTTSGFSTTKAENPVLAGDSMLRTITSRLSTAALTSVAGSGTYQTLGSIGISLAKDGTMSLDGSKLDKALAADASSVAQVLAGVSGDDGAMDVLKSTVEGFTTTGTGLVDARKEVLEARAKALDDRVAAEQKRLDWYQEMLRKQFSQMDQLVSGSNAQTAYLTALNSK